MSGAAGDSNRLSLGDHPRMRVHTRPRRRPDVAQDDVLHAVEAEFACHAMFGDSRSILARKRAIVRLQLEADLSSRNSAGSCGKSGIEERLSTSCKIRSWREASSTCWVRACAPPPHNETEDISS